MPKHYRGNSIFHQKCIFDERPYSPVDVAANGKRGLMLEYEVLSQIKMFVRTNVSGPFLGGSNEQPSNNGNLTIVKLSKLR